MSTGLRRVLCFEEWETMRDEEVLLAVETSTDWSSAAVLEGDSVLAEIGTKIKKDHSGPLVNRIENMVAECGLAIGDVSSVVISGGPGSFTGLRVGIGFAKGFVFGTRRRLYAVSALETIAAGMPGCGTPICVMLDARKGEVYTATFHWDAGELTMISDPVSNTPEHIIDSISSEMVFVGSGSLVYRDLLVDRLGERVLTAPASSSYPRAGVMGLLVQRNPGNYLVEDPSTFEPLYIRPPEAVKKWKRTEPK